MRAGTKVRLCRHRRRRNQRNQRHQRHQRKIYGEIPEPAQTLTKTTAGKRQALVLPTFPYTVAVLLLLHPIDFLIPQHSQADSVAIKHSRASSAPTRSQPSNFRFFALLLTLFYHSPTDARGPDPVHCYLVVPSAFSRQRTLDTSRPTRTAKHNTIATPQHPRRLDLQRKKKLITLHIISPGSLSASWPSRISEPGSRSTSSFRPQRLGSRLVHSAMDSSLKRKDTTKGPPLRILSLGMFTSVTPAALAYTRPC
jgi:hypothetical protein